MGQRIWRPIRAAAGPLDETIDYDYDSLVDTITGTLDFPPQKPTTLTTIPIVAHSHATLTITQDAKTQLRVAAVLTALRKSRDLKAARYDHCRHQRRPRKSTTPKAPAEKALDKMVKPDFGGSKLDELAD